MQTQRTQQSDFYPFYALIAYFWANKRKKKEEEVLIDIFRIMKLLGNKDIINKTYSTKEIYKKFQKLKALRIIEHNNGSIFYFLSPKLRKELERKKKPISFLTEDIKTQEVIKQVYKIVSDNKNQIIVD